jgi:fatty acid synthase subunit beta
MRDNYRALRYVAPDGDASKPIQIFPDIDHNTASYTFSSDAGLLFATQFTQPALTLTEVAIYEDLKSRGLVSTTTAFAGHSLGEYAAIAAFGGLVPLETLMAIAFYRGLSMHAAVQRDPAGRSAFAMCALNPSRLSQGMDLFLSHAQGLNIADKLSAFSNECGSGGTDCEDRL